ncbi:uncharacterized protein LOC113306494 [Papaver somniferum]|uniref:uncharacterized protein LOC113306494 n=1 Tax=Papaver somniferum TaxID=3469 RepID=UPI000E702656|nr:uncharacterized protein LOC113306494 [Papaver somniferum]
MYKSLAAEKLYPSCEDNLIILSAIVELHNVKKTYKISGNRVNNLLDLLREWLSKPNKFPKNYDVMRSMLKDLGMKAKAIHACENHCILYYEENEDLIECLFEFQMMTLLIHGRKSPGQDIDVFLWPLVNTLKKLWNQGVQAFDSLKREYFTLKATLMFGIHDLPAQGVLSGCTTHGYCARICCADETRSTHLGYDNKIVYTNYRIFLKKSHPFRDGTLLGLETQEHKSAPLRLTGAQSLEKLADVRYEPGKLVVRKIGKRKRYQFDEEEGDSELVTGAFFKKCILWELQSYCALTIRYCVDVMHTEKNVMEHIIYTL